MASGEQVQTVALDGHDAERFSEKLWKVYDLHAARERTIEAYNDAGYPQAVTLKTCRECGQDWPCPTVKIVRP